MSTNKPWSEVRAALEEALEKEPTERELYLQGLRESDPSLALEVEELLERDGEDDVSDGPAGDAWNTLLESGELPRGTRLGAYEVIATLASGGMGSVYRAERADAQFEKSVAIKLIKRGMDSDEIVRRFRQERQVLATLEHPGIARLVDGGVSSDGRPYLVMEFVDGVSIDAWCEEAAPALRTRLELFLHICDAVQYAHQRLVVHRDLKPSNILVGDDGQPKLLDFGVAKVLDTAGEGGGELTEERAFLGTPSFASPEQLRGERVTTSSDVYSLGVVLYQLLAGSRPFDLSRISREEAHRVVCHQAPQRPSQASKGAGVAPRELRGDLDNIVLMALRKEPERRYGSAAELAADLRRFLSGQPVEARPNTLRYRTSKFLSRNRVPVVTTLVLLGGLIAGLVTSARLYVEAAEAREDAVGRYEDMRRMAATLIFEVSGQMGPLEGSVRAREAIVTSALFYLDRLAQEGEADPTILHDLARAYLLLGDLQGGALSSNLGRREDARASYAKAEALIAELEARVPGGELAAALRAERDYRLADLELLAGESGAAEALLRRALEACPEGAESRAQRLTRSIALARLGDLHVREGRAAEAVECFEGVVREAELLASRDAEGPEPRRTLAVACNKLSEARFYAGEAEEAERLCRRACELVDDLIGEHAARGDFAQVYVSAYFWLGNLLLRKGDISEGIAALEAALEQSRQIVQADPENALARFNLGQGLQVLAGALSSAGRVDEASACLVEIQEGARRTLEIDPNDTKTLRQLGAASSTLAGIYIQLEDWPAAEHENGAALEVFERLRAAHPEEAAPRRDLASCLTNVGALHMAQAALETLPSPIRRSHAQAAEKSFAEARGHLQALADTGRLAPAVASFIGRLDSYERDARALLESISEP